MITVPPVLATIPSCVLYIRPFGAVGGSTLRDQSPLKTTITLGAGTVTNSNTYSKFPPASLYFSAAYFTEPNNIHYCTFTGDFAFSWWEYLTSAKTAGSSVFTNVPSTTLGFNIGYSDGTNNMVFLSSNGSTWNLKSAWSMGAQVGDAWTHWGLTRISGVLTAYKNGVQSAQASGVTGTVYNSGTNLYVGSYPDYPVTAYYDEICIFNGSYGPVPTGAMLYNLAQRRMIA